MYVHRATCKQIATCASSDVRILDLPMPYRISPSTASPDRIRPTRRAGLWRVQGMYSLLVSAIIFRQVAIQYTLCTYLPTTYLRIYAFAGMRCVLRWGSKLCMKYRAYII